MSWPRKNDVGRIYRDKDRKTFFVVFVDDDRNGQFDALANALSYDSPSICTTGISRGYIASNFLKRVAWNDLSREWQNAFAYFLVDDPATIRGFWRIGEQPSPIREVAR
jgi:hypothetical protein